MRFGGGCGVANDTRGVEEEERVIRGCGVDMLGVYDVEIVLLLLLLLLL
jgi:hypothetical protein